MSIFPSDFSVSDEDLCKDVDVVLDRFTFNLSTPAHEINAALAQFTRPPLGYYIPGVLEPVIKASGVYSYYQMSRLKSFMGCDLAKHKDVISGDIYEGCEKDDKIAVHRHTLLTSDFCPVPTLPYYGLHVAHEAVCDSIAKHASYHQRSDNMQRYLSSLLGDLAVDNTGQPTKLFEEVLEFCTRSMKQVDEYIAEVIGNYTNHIHLFLPGVGCYGTIVRYGDWRLQQISDYITFKKQLES